MIVTASSVLTLATWAGAVFGAVFGACLASFGCVVAERRPRGESLGGRSHCACGRQLRAYENVPVLAWLLLRGKTRCCGVRLPARYVLAEAGLAAVDALLGAYLWRAFAAGTLGVAGILGVVLIAVVGFAGVVGLTRPRG